MNNLREAGDSQHLNDHWDIDHPFERILVDTAVAPRPERRELGQPSARERRDAPSADRHSRQDRRRLHPRPRHRRFLWARPTVTQNVISDINGATGDVTENAVVVFSAEGQEVLAAPPGSAARTARRGPTAR